MKHVIIGNSAAAVGCAEAIREASPFAQIVMIASEPHHTYSRPLISYLLGGKTTEAKMRYRPLWFYQDLDICPRLGCTVEAIDPAHKCVTLNGGERIDYDKLLISTGSTPFVPPIEGLDHVKSKCGFMTLNDAHTLMALTPGSRVLVVGAGLIGLKCVEGLSHRGMQITVCDLSPQVLPSILPPDAAPLVARHIEAQDVTLMLEDTVVRFDENAAHMRSGRCVIFDHLVMAVGVRANTAISSAAGIPVNRGILVDEYACTNLPDVYAAGDCAEGIDAVTGQRRVLAVLPNAYAQGARAGAHMAGGTFDAPAAIALNAIGFWGLHILSAGTYEGERYVRVREDNYRMLCTQGNRLMGFVLIGNVARAGIYTQLIRERTKLSSIDFERIRDNPGLMAFSSVERKRKLEGVGA